MIQKTGTGVRDYIHVVDLAKGHIKALQKLEKEKKGLFIYNLGTGNGYSVLDMVKAFEKATGKPVPYKIVPRRKGDIATCYADPKKAKEELGWVATRGIDEMCKDSWNYINHKYAYTVEFDSEELIQKAITHIDEKMFVAKLQYTVTTGEQGSDWNTEKLKSGDGFVAEKSRTFTLTRTEETLVKYDLVGKVAEGAKLTRRSAARILSGIKPYTFAMFKNNPEEFIVKAIRLINEQKVAMIVEQITYNKAEGSYDANIFTAEKNTDFSRAYRAKKNVQDYVFADGYARNGQSVERRFAEDMDLADEVCVYAKLPKGFSIPTPVGNYSPDWAIAFHKGTVKHIFFIAETKGTMETFNLKAIEKAKIDCAKKLFKSLSGADVVYDSVDSYHHLLDIMESL